MSMPEASVDEDGPSSLSVRDVRRPGEVSVVDTIVVSEIAEDSPDLKLRGSVALADSAEPRRGLRVDQ